jgi:drug/metabolite transporter (DMT)-like permease
MRLGTIRLRSGFLYTPNKMLNEALVLVSEVVLSAYPSLIKLVDASVLFQTGLRMIVFTVLAIGAAITTGSPVVSISLLSTETIYTGLLNLLHVGSSYTAFHQLEGGNAMALFYTYPVWNILGAAWLFGESISIASIPWVLLALIGAIGLSQPSTRHWTALGVVMALVAALTETGIYLWFKTRKEGEDAQQPWTKMIQMFGSSSVLWGMGVAIAAVLGLLAKNVFQISGGGLASILGFNTLIGFVGYALRFYLIPKVSTVVFSALSFFGVVAAYGMGWIFSNEVPSVIQALGAVAIIIANAALLSKSTV